MPAGPALEPVADLVRAPNSQPLAPPQKPDAPAGGDEPVKKRGWFQRLKAGLTKTSSRLSQDIAGIFTKRKLDADTLEELEELLIQADLGVETAMRITAALAQRPSSTRRSRPKRCAPCWPPRSSCALAPVAKPLRIEGDQ